MESSVEKFKPTFPKPYDIKFYKHLAKTISSGTVAVCRGCHSFYQLGKAREYLDHLAILQIHPRHPDEVRDYIRQLRERKTNVAVVDLRWIPDKYENPFKDDKTNRYAIYDFRVAF